MRKVIQADICLKNLNLIFKRILLEIIPNIADGNDINSKTTLYLVAINISTAMISSLTVNMTEEEKEKCLEGTVEMFKEKLQESIKNVETMKEKYKEL